MLSPISSLGCSSYNVQFKGNNQKPSAVRDSADKTPRVPEETKPKTPGTLANVKKALGKLKYFLFGETQRRTMSDGSEVKIHRTRGGVTEYTVNKADGGYPTHRIKVARKSTNSQSGNRYYNTTKMDYDDRGWSYSTITDRYYTADGEKILETVRDSRGTTIRTSGDGRRSTETILDNERSSKDIRAIRYTDDIDENNEKHCVKHEMFDMYGTAKRD